MCYGLLMNWTHFVYIPQNNILDRSCKFKQLYGKCVHSTCNLFDEILDNIIIAHTIPIFIQNINSKYQIDIQST